MKQIIALLLLIFCTNVTIAQLPYVQHAAPPGLPQTSSLQRSNEVMVDGNNNKWVCFASFGLGIYDNNTWTTFNIANSSLPSDSAICVDFDNMGNAWIGTKLGAAYKNGNIFTVYNSSNSGLPSNIITAVLCDGPMVWFGTYEGLVVFDGTFWNIYNTQNSGLENDSITTLATNGLGEIWVGTRNGLAKLSNGLWTNYNTTNSIINRCIFDIECDLYGRTWISAGKAIINFYSFNTTEIYFIENGQVNFFKDHYIIEGFNCYYQSSNNISKNTAGKIYFQALGCTERAGIFEIDGQNINFYDLPENSPLFTLFGIFKIDQNNNLWYLKRAPYLLYSFDINDYNYPFGNLTIKNYQIMNINKVSAGINVNGMSHWDHNEPEYEVPEGKGKHSVFASALWIGGLDQQGQLHLAGQTYRQWGLDYWPGPTDGITIPFDTTSSIMFDKIWKIDKWKIEEFKNEFLSGNVANGSYPIPDEFATWPGKNNGVVMDNLAPFVDFNSDGIYNPIDGDYPLIKGDQMLYNIFNDSLAPHTESSGQKMGIEVHASSYAFNCENIADSNQVINWTTFYNYQIINRSQHNYDSVYIGLWCDMDLGCSSDDYVGCDTTRASAFTFNGDNHDETLSGYGFNPPIQNIKILRGALADLNDGVDNNLNGINDESGERTTMNGFVSYENVNNSPVGNPTNNPPSTSAVAENKYKYLKSIWLDGRPITYGSDGRDTTSYATKFMFSGIPYSGTGWTEGGANTPPGDRRFIMSSGPVSLDAGDTINLDFAYVFSWDSLNPNGLLTSIARNQADLDRVQYWFDTNSFPSCETFTTDVEDVFPEIYSIYPNPASTILHIHKSKYPANNLKYSVYNMLGELVMMGKINSGMLNIDHLTEQVYILKIEAEVGSTYLRFVKCD